MILRMLIVFLLVIGCKQEAPIKFSDKALKEQVVYLNDTTSSFEEVIEQYKGKTVLIDVWASWCSDCIKGLPVVKDLQKQFPEVVFLFLSVDENNEAWKRGITRFKIEGEHYNLPKGMKKGDFVDFVDLSWIPRYIIINKQGNIELFNATKATDDRIIELLKKA